MPKGEIVGVELTDDAEDLETFKHPDDVYLLGAEDHGLPKRAIEKSHHLIKFKSELSVNVAVAGSIVMIEG